METEVIELARQLGGAIQKDETYIDYKIKEQNVECDEHLQKMMKDFNLKKSEINEEISKDNTDQNKIDKLNEEINKLYTEIMQNETMTVYTKAKQKFEGVLRGITLIINRSSFGEDPRTVNIEESDTCSGGCQSCLGCS